MVVRKHVVHLAVVRVGVLRVVKKQPEDDLQQRSSGNTGMTTGHVNNNKTGLVGARFKLLVVPPASATGSEKAGSDHKKQTLVKLHCCKESERAGKDIKVNEYLPIVASYVAEPRERPS